MSKADEYAALRAQNKGWQEIANMYGVSRQAVQKAVKLKTNPLFRNKIAKEKAKIARKKYNSDPVFREKRIAAVNLYNERKTQNV